MPLGPQPRELDTGLAALHVDTQHQFERSWQTLRGYLTELLSRGGIDPLAAEELTVLPGAAEVLALLEVRDRVARGPWDAVVVDCAPTAETLRLLALPEALSWYVERLFPTHRRMVRALRPALGRLGAAPLPGDGVLDAATRLYEELRDVRALLADRERTAVRLVLTPESMVLAEARRTLTTLALHGHRVDSVVANRVVPAGDGADEWRSSWAAEQARQLAEVRESFPGVPLRLASYRPFEPVGSAALLELARELYGGDDPLAAAAPAEAMAIERDGAEFLLRLPLPFAERSEVELARSGDELVVTVGGHRRLLTLPSGLRRCVAVGAAVSGGALRVRFRPDPELWPR